ncbi:MAG: single-stranded DNA-binding protein [Byssovorax sp.]
MSDGMNKVLLLGNLGANPDLRFTAGGTAVLNFRVATSETFLDRNKEPQSRTDWHSVVVWGPRGQGLAKVLIKGTMVLIEGGLRSSSYERDGVRRYKTEIHAKDVHLVGRRPPPDDSGAPTGELADETLEGGEIPPSDVRGKPPARKAAPPRDHLDEMPY